MSLSTPLRHDWRSDTVAQDVRELAEALSGPEAKLDAVKAEAEAFRKRTKSQETSLIDLMRDLHADSIASGLDDEPDADGTRPKVSWYQALGEIVGHVALIEVQAPAFYAMRQDGTLDKRLARAWSKARARKRDPLAVLRSALERFERDAPARSYREACAVLAEASDKLESVADTFEALTAAEAKSA